MPINFSRFCVIASLAALPYLLNAQCGTGGKPIPGIIEYVSTTTLRTVAGFLPYDAYDYSANAKIETLYLTESWTGSGSMWCYGNVTRQHDLSGNEHFPVESLHLYPFPQGCGVINTRRDTLGGSTTTRSLIDLKDSAEYTFHDNWDFSRTATEIHFQVYGNSYLITGGGCTWLNADFTETLSDPRTIADAEASPQYIETGHASVQYCNAWPEVHPASLPQPVVEAGTYSVNGGTARLNRANQVVKFRVALPPRPCKGEYRLVLKFKEWTAGSTTVQIRDITAPELISLDKESTTYWPSTTEYKTYTELGLSTATNQSSELISAELHAIASCDQLPAGTGSFTLGSVDFTLSLGRVDADHSAGALVLGSETVTTDLFSPRALQLATNPAVTITRDENNAVRQIVAPEVGVDIVPLSNQSYVVRSYLPSQIGTPDPATGLCAFSGAPVKAYTFTGNNSGTLPSITIAPADSPARTATYTWDAATATMTMAQPGADRIETIATTTPAITEVRTIRNNAGNLVARETSRYTDYPFGRVLISHTRGTGSDAQITTTSYYTDASDTGNYGHIKKIIEPSGAWTLYAYDSQGRVCTERRRRLNHIETGDKIITTTRDSIPDQDGDDLSEERVTRVERIDNIETSRFYEINFTGVENYNGLPTKRTDSIQAVSAGAASTASSNLISISRTVASGPYADKPASSLTPDGILTTYGYSTDSGTGAVTTTIASGASNPAHTAVVSGTRTVTVDDAFGRTSRQTTTDIATATVLSSSVVATQDDFGRPTRVNYGDGTSELSSYACCGLETLTDRHGAFTAYAYDALGRLEYITRAGIMTQYTYDAAGDRHQTIRIGTDNSRITLESNLYDTAGRLTQSVNARGWTTTYNYLNLAEGGSCTTTTGPGGSTTVETVAADGQILKIEGTAVPLRAYDYLVNSDGTQTSIEYFPAANIDDATAWRSTTTDFLGRPSAESSPISDSGGDLAISSRDYDNVGRLVRQSDPDGVQTLYGYNSEGQLTTTALDLDHNGVIDYDGTDRVTRTTTSYASRSNLPVRRTAVEVWKAPNDATPFTVSTTETTLDELQTWQIRHGDNPDSTNDDLITRSQTAYTSGETRTDTITSPDGTTQTSVSIQGRPQSVTVAHPTLGTLSSTTYDYDPQGRLWHVHAATGTSTYIYFDNDQIKSVTTPDPDTTRSGTGYNPQTTAYASTYTSSGRVDTVTHPDGTVTTTEYYPSGQVHKTYGSRTYPQAYTYDAQQRVKTLTTWQDYAAQTGAAITTWNYDPETGRLLNKRDAGDQGASYTYTPAGRLETRTWARQVEGAPLITTYGYNDAGDLESIHYSDATPHVEHSYDRLGRLETTFDAAGLLSRVYEVGRLKNEVYTGTGLLSGQQITRTFDDFYRLGSLSVPSASSVGYTYDGASRLATVAQGTHVATQNYHATRGYPETVSITNSGTPRLVSTRTLDNLGRVTSMVTPAVSSTTYEYNDANQRIKATALDGSYWSYGYDALGQVTSAIKRNADTTPRPGHSFGYAYDDIGNRTGTTLNSLGSVYSPNLKNQYESRTTPPAIPVLGTAASTATVKVNHESAANRSGDWFYHELALDDSGAPRYLEFPVSATTQSGGPPPTSELVRSERRTAFVPASPEVFIHDADGNLTQDGRWNYTWDAENRLVGMQTRPDVVATTPGLPYQRLTFTYDAQSRRIGKKLETYVSEWTTTYEKCFLYDGWNLVAELDWNASTSICSLTSSYVWGLDLSGSAQGAGGVSSLLWASVASANYAPSYDGNGNIIAWIDLSTGAKVAKDDYDAFGNVIKIARANPVSFGFSTKYEDSETGLLHYGLRYYQPQTGRWLNRDSLGEVGGNNLYGFIGNDGINTTDLLGLARNGSGHTYSTYLAIAYVLGLPNAGNELAVYASMPDTLESRSAYTPRLIPKVLLNYISFGRLAPDFNRIQRYLHSLAGGDPQALQACLASMLGQNNLKPWQQGFLIHALGDSYFHVNKKGMLYKAPFGHGEDSTDGHDPDQILFGSQRQTKLAPFLIDLTNIMNRGPLDSAQQGRLLQLLGEIAALPTVSGKTTGQTGLDEDKMFYDLAVSHGYDPNGYKPEDGLGNREYINKYGTSHALPSDNEVQEFLKLIKCHCGK